MTFGARLKRCMKVGNLTVADLSRWFVRPYPTVRSWVRGRAPRGAPGDRKNIDTRLQVLETRIAKRRGFPVPALSQRARIGYLKKLIAR